MRNFFIILLVVLAIAAAAVSAYFVLLKEETTATVEHFDAIPLDAGIIVDIRDWDSFHGLVAENSFWLQLCKIASLGQLNDELEQWDAFSRKQDMAAILRGHLVFSLHPVGKDEMNLIGFVRMSAKETDHLKNAFKQQWAGTATTTTREYDKTTITDVAFTRKEDATLNFSYAFRKGYLIFSRSTLLLENALRHLDSGEDITRQGKLADLMRTAGKNAAANLYLNYAQMPRATQTLFHADHFKSITPVVNFADWTALDLNLKPELLLLNGFTASDSKSDKWLATLQRQQPLPISLTDAMPPTTYAFFWMGIQQISQYFADYGTYLGNNKDLSYKRELDRIVNTYHFDLQREFTEQFENEMAQVYPYLGQLSQEGDVFVLFRIKSTSAALAMIEDWQANVSEASGKRLDEMRQKLQFDEKLAFTAYHIPFDVPGALFGQLFAGKHEWCAVMDNYLLFGATPEHLKRYLHYTALHASLQTDLTYGRLSNEFASRCNLMFYCNPSESNSFFKQIFKPDAFKELEAAEEVVSQVHAAVFQLSTSGEMWYNNIFVKQQSTESIARSAGLQTSWESMLDTAIAFKPQLVQNHNTGETEVFVQDMAGNACLLNNIGRILWKTPIADPILSAVYQIDLYKNNKLQMLFNTRNHIYLVDRLGNMVDKFPIRLPSPAVGAISVFDYEKNRDYRIMVACEDRKVYTYDKNGKIVAGWQFSQSEHPVQTEIYHHRASNKDYIVFADKYKVYILDRQGRTRVSPEYNFPVGKHTAIELNNASLVMTDTVGTLHFISLADGSIRKQTIKKYSPAHFFDFRDVDGDRQNDFIFADGDKIEAFRQDGSQIFSITADETVSMRPNIYEFAANDMKIGIVAPRKNLIYLYNSKGKLQKGFPLTGSTLFSVGRLDKLSRNFNLFVGSSNNFLYNYPIEN
ncbi:MAG: hypothetical protein LBN37_05075 [Bacteroidales bacterium]|jgi:hypothetical protein|nr:hypothetical protein [Bacteroidales bacterium]